ncbi:hypothetical protein PVAP13_1NG067200 [Panicum virgatum]|uniref:Urease accessory protein D n=1 Tax=Panicum virgatum TaxID=38727 RepID=A0A8T0WSX1_PANVG|nr:hypothetical protein PVAP13_1NG067200 [Panicum virgatum]
MAEAATGAVRVEKVRGRSALTRCFARYPLKLIAPSKVGPASCDAVWLYALTYGGGIVSGDTISCTVIVGDGCTAAITTQASTKVYKAMGSRCSEQLLEVLLEQCSNWSLAEQMQEYNVIAMVVLLGPKLKSMQEQMQAEVRKLMSGQLRPPTSCGSLYAMRSQPAPQRPQRPPTHRLLQLIWSHRNRHGCPGSRGEHRARVQLPETPSGCSGAVPWCLPLCCIMKFTQPIGQS